MSFIVRTAVLAVPLALSMPLVLAQPADPHARHAVPSTPSAAASGRAGAGAAVPVAASAGAVPTAPAAPATESAGSAYRSAFDGYRGFIDQPVESWRKANDEVGQIGGWKAYAREGQSGGAGRHEHAMPVEAEVSPPPAATPSAARPGSHAGHRMP